MREHIIHFGRKCTHKIRFYIVCSADDIYSAIFHQRKRFVRYQVIFSEQIDHDLTYECIDHYDNGLQIWWIEV